MREVKLNLQNQGEMISLLSKINNESTYFIPTNIYNKLLKMDKNELPLISRQKVIEQICKFINYLYKNIYYVKENQLEISKNTFIRIFSIHSYIAFKDLLKKLNIISQIKHKDGMYYSFSDGISKNYRIYNSFLNEIEHSIVIFNSNTEKQFYIGDLNFNMDERMKKTIQNITVDKDKAIRVNLNEYNKGNISKFSLLLRLSKIFNLDKKRFIKQGKKVNRVFHSFSNLDKLTRKCIQPNFIESDVKNCQPMLLVIFLTKYMNIKDKDFKRYKKHCEQGIFYEQLMIDGATRKQTKVNTYKSIFFNFNKKFKVNKKFKELYPNVWNTLNYITQNYKDISLALELQNLEALLFNSIIPKFSRQYFTLHDAIYYTNKKDTSYIKKQINEFFKQYNLKVSITVNKNELDNNLLVEYNNKNTNNVLKENNIGSQNEQAIDKLENISTETNHNPIIYEKPIDKLENNIGSQNEQLNDKIHKELCKIDLKEFKNVLVKKLESMYGKKNIEILTKNKHFKPKFINLLNNLLNKAKSGIKISNEQIEQEINNIKKMNN